MTSTTTKYPLQLLIRLTKRDIFTSVVPVSDQVFESIKASQQNREALHDVRERYNTAASEFSLESLLKTKGLREYLSKLTSDHRASHTADSDNLTWSNMSDAIYRKVMDKIWESSRGIVREAVTNANCRFGSSLAVAESEIKIIDFTQCKHSDANKEKSLEDDLSVGSSSKGVVMKQTNHNGSAE